MLNLAKVLSMVHGSLPELALPELAMCQPCWGSLTCFLRYCHVYADWESTFNTLRTADTKKLIVNIVIR